MWAVGHKDPEKGQQKWNTKRSSFQPVAEATREKQHKIRTAMFVSKFIIKQKKKNNFTPSTFRPKHYHEQLTRKYQED